MKDYLLLDEWSIIEKGLHPNYNRISESVCSLGNGRFGQRGNFEEYYSGNTLQGNYVAGVYYPDKTRVGWWKNGYPQYFAKVLNAANWIGIDWIINGERLDLHTCRVTEFERVLDMKAGQLRRTFTATLPNGNIVKAEVTRFCSIADDEIGAIEYRLTAVNFDGNISATPFIDLDVENEDSNYDEKFWLPVQESTDGAAAYVTAETKKTAFHVCAGMTYTIAKNGELLDVATTPVRRDKYAATSATFAVEKGDTLTLCKYAAVLSSMNYAKADLLPTCRQAVARAAGQGFAALQQAQANAWAAKWETSDITIEGDVAAAQGIRFNIFQLNQTYTGEDERLNIGPKGFTGEKYGGSTYWDTEAYCLPFYLATADSRVARQLLVYRYRHLEKAIENAELLGFKEGAALYPMVTMNGEECHNEWEITFEEIHRNGAIAYAIYDYVRYTADSDYLIEYGAEVLLGIARFWSQRVNWSEKRYQYVILGVTGPNEYENNVNNNWYTNYIARWCLEYAEYALDYVARNAPEKYATLVAKTGLNASEEFSKWQHIRKNMYFPYDDRAELILQQDNYLDKEQLTVADLAPEHRPLNKKWSWDRILRSCFIKQADVLQGMYFFEDHFNTDVIRRSFDFYEPRTVHESSLSPCVHAILAAKLGLKDKAYEMYLRTARLDLNDFNSDTDEGLHITSMAGTWMAVVKGFGGMRVTYDMISFAPYLPEKWQSFSFNVRFRDHLLNVEVRKNETRITNQSDTSILLMLHREAYRVNPHDTLTA